MRVILTLFILIVAEALTAQICGEDIKISGNPGESQIFYIGDAVQNCNGGNYQYVVDIDFLDLPDMVEVGTDKVFNEETTRLTTELIGREIDTIFTYQGFLIYTLYKNDDHSITFRNNVPSSFRFSGPSVGKFRLVIKSATKDVWLKFTYGPQPVSELRFYVYCKDLNRAVRTDTIYTCYEPSQLRESVITVNCDTIHIDSINVSQIGAEQTDTVTWVSNQLDPGFYVLSWFQNDYGCQVPWKVRHVVRPDVKIYIPNVFMPEGNNNTIFEASRPVTYYRIYNRSGGLVHDSHDGWNGGDWPAGVYAYEIKAPWRERPYFGGVTLIR